MKTYFLILYSLLVIHTSKSQIIVNGVIKNYNIDSIGVFIFDNNNFDPIFPKYKIPIVNNQFSISINNSGHIRVVLGLGKKFLIPSVLAKSGTFYVNINFFSGSTKYKQTIIGQNYSGNELDSIDIITFAPPNKFMPFKYYPQFINVLDSFTQKSISISRLSENVNEFISKFGKKYFDLYQEKKIEKWFLEYRVLELKSNMLFELIENIFGSNLIAPEYQSKHETELLKRVHHKFKYKDSLQLWNTFIKYASVDGLLDYPYMQYRFVYTHSFKNQWYNSTALKKVLLAANYKTQNSKFPIPSNIDKSIIELRLSETIMGKIRSRENIDDLIKIIKNNFHNSPSLIYAINQHAKANSLLTKKLNFKIIKVDDNLPFLDLLKKISNGQMLFIDLWAHWCGHCKEEFVNETTTLDSFLNVNKIKRLYIAIGNSDPKSLAKVQSNIKQYKLNGMHIITSKKLEKEIYKIVYKNEESFPIPRYLITDRYGNIANNNSPRPSINNGEELMKELKKISESINDSQIH